MNIKAMAPRGAKWNSERLEYVRSRASITPEVVRLAAEGMSTSALAKRFEVSFVTIWRILKAN